MNRLKELRKGKGITTRDLADKLNITYTAISKMENGQQSLTNDYISLFCNFFNVTADHLLGYEKQTEKNDDSFLSTLYDETKGFTQSQKDMLLGIIQVIKNTNNK